MGAILNPLQMRSPVDDRLVELSGDRTGFASVVFNKYLTNLDRLLWRVLVQDVVQFGARGNGFTDDTDAFQRAVNTAVKAGGGIIFIPAGTYRIKSVFVPVGAGPISFVGQGFTSILKRIGNLLPGTGMLDISSSYVLLQDFGIDGDTLVSRGLQYNADFNGIGGNDPMANSLTQNTSIWIHGPASQYAFNRVYFTHAGGYSILLDAMTGDVSDVDIVSCQFQNNRPTTFGIAPGNLIYGSWNGGVFAKGDGRTALAGVVSNVNLTGCKFHRNTGNCFWQHLYGLTRLNSNIRATNNSFLDCGLDGILIGGVTGGIVSNNTFRRVGYVCSTDTDQGTPRWLPGVQATALDSSGLVINVPYTDNSFLDINGGCIDGDGHGQSTFNSNVMRVAAPGDPEYIDDQCAICGPTNSGAVGYGINIGDTSQETLGASNIAITGNTFINLSAGSVRLYAARYCLVEGNVIISPDVPVGPPISIGPTGVNPNQRATGNKVCHNQIYYNPPVAAPAVFEDPTLTPFLVTDVNQVFGNVPIQPTGTLATEFEKDPSSGSPVYAETVWFP